MCWGRNYEEAFQAAYDLEKACGEYLANLNSEILSANKGDTEQVGSKVILNRSQILLDFAELTDEMRPYLDDFAQIVGPSMKVLPKDQDLAEQEAARGRSIIVRGVGAFCTARNLSDVQAISQIVEKNAMAFFAASITGAKPIKNLDCMRMRQRYLHQYAKLAKK